MRSMGMAKPMPCPLLETAVFMPITWPLASASGPPELPGLIGASVWIRPARRSPLVCSDLLRAEMMPEVTDGPPGASPRALPMATTGSPTWRPEDLPILTGVSVPGFWIWMTAMSSAVSVPSTLAWYTVDWPKTCTLTVLEPLTTWAFVTTLPWVSRTMPLPSPWVVPPNVPDAEVLIMTTPDSTARRTERMSRDGAVPVGGVVAAVRSEASVPEGSVVLFCLNAPRALAITKTATSSEPAATRVTITP